MSDANTNETESTKKPWKLMNVWTLSLTIVLILVTGGLLGQWNASRSVVEPAPAIESRAYDQSRGVYFIEVEGGNATYRCEFTDHQVSRLIGCDVTS